MQAQPSSDVSGAAGLRAGSALLLGALLAVLGCERPPARVEPGAPAAVQAPSGSPEAVASAFQPPFRGSVVLRGELANAAGGAVVFVTVKPRGQNMPVLIKKFDLADASLPAAVGGERRIDFGLTQNDAMNGEPLTAPLVGDFDIEGLFDPSGLTDKTVQVRDRRPLAAGPIELTLQR